MSEQEFEVYLRMVSKMLRLSDAQRDVISDELRDHLEARLEELSGQGVDRSEAVQVALSEFGDVNNLVRDFIQINHLKIRRRFMHTTLGTLAACAAVTFAVMIYTPTNRQGQSLQSQAMAQNDDLSQIRSELEALRAENEALRQSLSMVTASRMKELAMAVFIYAEKEGQDETKLTKPSQLRDYTDFQSFLAPYDRAYQASMQLDEDVDVWAWVDENSSFVLRGGKAGDPRSILLEERAGLLSGHRWVIFGDGHGELIETKSETE